MPSCFVACLVFRGHQDDIGHVGVLHKELCAIEDPVVALCSGLALDGIELKADSRFAEGRGDE